MTVQTLVIAFCFFIIGLIWYVAEDGGGKVFGMIVMGFSSLFIAAIILPVIPGFWDTLDAINSILTYEIK